jgi:hypothetical protein
MKIPEFKRSGIGIITEFHWILNGFPNQGMRCSKLKGAFADPTGYGAFAGGWVRNWSRSNIYLKLTGKLKCNMYSLLNCNMHITCVICILHKYPYFI